MQDDVLLTLHCPQCKQLAEVVVESDNLICIECGWRFDDKTAARYLNNEPPPSSSTESKTLA
jgi:phage FluMu protein Com